MCISCPRCEKATLNTEEVNLVNLNVCHCVSLLCPSCRWCSAHCLVFLSTVLWKGSRNRAHSRYVGRCSGWEDRVHKVPCAVVMTLQTYEARLGHADGRVQ